MREAAAARAAPQPEGGWEDGWLVASLSFSPEFVCTSLKLEQLSLLAGWCVQQRISKSKIAPRSM